jgi:hypothetical protein
MNKSMRNMLVVAMGVCLFSAGSVRAITWTYSFIDNETPNMDRIEVFITSGSSVFSDPVTVSLAGWTSELVNSRYTTASGYSYSGDFLVQYTFAGTAPTVAPGNEIAFLAWSGTELIGRWAYISVPFGEPQSAASWKYIDTDPQSFDRRPVPDGGMTLALLSFGMLSLAALRRKMAR